MPRTHVTICGAPKPMAIPRIAPDAPPPRHSICHRHAAQHHDENDGDRRQPGENIRLQRTCARHERRGLRQRQIGRADHRNERGSQRQVRESAGRELAVCSASCRILNLRLQRADFVLTAPRGQLFTLCSAGSAEAEILHDE